MWAPSTSASVIMMILPYRAVSRSKLRPEPAPITWMIAAHSEFLSMSVMEAFCTLRILPRMGSRAWNSERSEEHTSELQSRGHLVCRLLLEEKTTSSDVYFMFYYIN